jgi:putative endonuclease
MAKTRKRALGDVGEAIARVYLERRGFTILEQNYLKPWGEIDLIAKDAGGELRFVEVKSVAHTFGKVLGTRETLVGEGKLRPEENMHERKVRRLYRAIQTYLLENKLSAETVWKIDLACVYVDMDARRGRVEMLENIVI